MTTQPRRVLHTNFLHGWGGQSNRILTECAGLAALGWEILISAPSDSQLVARAKLQGLGVDERIGYAGLKSGALRDIMMMRQLLREFRPDIVHLHGGKDSWLFAGATALGCPVPLPVVIRTKHNVFPVKDHALNRWQYGRLFDSIVCLSAAIVEQMRAKPYVDPEKLVQIPSAIDPERFRVPAGTRDRVRQEFGFEEHHVVIGMNGRLRPEKGHDILIRAIPAIADQFPLARFLIVGSGGLASQLSRQIDGTGYSDRVIMAGFREDVPDCLAAMDIYVQPSRSEGQGTTIVEASAAGLPIVASRTGGIPDVVVDGETGILVEPESPSALADGMRRMLQDAGLRARFGKAAQARAADKFSVSTMIARTDELYRTVLEKQRAESGR